MSTQIDEAFTSDRELIERIPLSGDAQKLFGIHWGWYALVAVAATILVAAFI